MLQGLPNSPQQALPLTTPPSGPNAPNTASAPPSAGAAQPPQPAIQATPTIELDLKDFSQDQLSSSGQSLESANIDANQLDFDKLSGQILKEVAKVEKLKPESTLLIRIGQEAIEIPTLRLDKATLLNALKRHFQALQSPGHQAVAKDLQSSAQGVLLQIRDNPAATALPSTPLRELGGAEAFTLKTLEKEINQKIPAAVREKYGLNAESLAKWQETGTPPAGLGSLLQDFDQQHQSLFQPLLYAVSFGKAVNAARQKAGLMNPEQVKTANLTLDELKGAASQKWEKHNAGAVRDTRKVAEKALGEWQTTDQAMQALKAKPSLTPAEQKQLDSLRSQATSQKTKSEKAMATAQQTAIAMKEVRVYRVEVNGGADAPLGMREKAAHAILDAASVEAQSGKQAVALQGGALTAEALPEGMIDSAQQLVAEAEKMLPEWQANQSVIDQRQEVLQSTRDLLKPVMDSVDQQKHLADRIAKLQSELKGLPKPSMSLPEHDARRAALEAELEGLEAEQHEILRPDPLGSPTAPAEVKLLSQYGKNVAQLQATYAADIQLNNRIGGGSPAQQAKVEKASKASRDLHMEAAKYGQDGQEAALAEAKSRQGNSHYQQFGRMDLLQRISAAEATIAKYADAKTPGQNQKLADAQKDLAAAMQEMRDGEALSQAGNVTPGSNFAVLRAKALAEALGLPPGPNPAQSLARSEEAAAVSRHSLLGAVMHDKGAWGAENGSFLQSRAQLQQRELDRSQGQAQLESSINSDAERHYGEQKSELSGIPAQLKELPPGPERDKLLARQKELKDKVAAYEASPLGMPGGPEWVNNARLDALTAGPVANIRTLQAQQAENVTAMAALLAQNPHSDSLKKQAVATYLSAAATLPQHTPGASADSLLAALKVANSLPEKDKASALALVRKEAISIYQAYVLNPHASAASATAALAAAVEKVVETGNQADESRSAWQELRRQSNPIELFKHHKAELELALEELQNRVTDDIESGYNLAVERGGLAVGTAARIARSMARDGDIAGAKKLLAEAVAKEIQKAEAAESAYSQLPAPQQEQYRAILRSTAPAGEKQEALEGVFGYSIGGSDGLNASASKQATQALAVADSTQTMKRANAPGSDYDQGRSAAKTLEKLNQYSSGLKAQGGPAAERIAARSAAKLQRDEAYWNDPKIAVMAAITDEALMFVATMGMSTALTLAKGSVTGISAARQALSMVRAGRTALEGNRAGRAILTAGHWVSRGNQKFSYVLARADSAAMGVSPLLGYGFRASRSLTRNIVMEELPKAASELAKQYGDADGWLQWAVDTTSRFAVSNLGDIKGLESLQNSTWTVFETMVTQMALPAYFKNDPQGLKDAQDLTHYFLMGAQTAHGMAKMHSDAKLKGQSEGLALTQDLAEKAGLELDPKIQEQIVKEVHSFQEGLLNNKDLSTPGHQSALEKSVKSAVAFDKLPPEAQARVEASLKDFLHPYQVQTATQISGVASLHPEFSTAAEVAVKTQDLASMLQKQGLAQDAAEALKMARGQVAGQLIQKSPLHVDGDLQNLPELAQKEAQRLLDLGAVDSPAHAMLLVQHQLRQLAIDTAPLLLTNKAEGQAQFIKIQEQLKALDALSPAFVHSASALPKELGSHGQAVQKIAMELLHDAPEGALQTQLSLRVEKYLQTQKLSPAEAQILTQKLVSSLLPAWGEHLLQQRQLKGEVPSDNPIAQHDAHLQILKGFGLHEEQAGQLAHDRMLGQLESAWQSAAPPEQSGKVKALLHEVLGKAGKHPEADADTRKQWLGETQKQLEGLGIPAKEATVMAARLVLDGIDYGKRFQGTDSLPRTRSMNASLEEALHLPHLELAGQKLTDLNQLRGFLQSHLQSATGDTATPAQDAVVMQFYEAVGGWDNVRKLAQFLPPEIFGKLHQARDRQVETCWDQVQAKAKELGLELAPPYVGRGPKDAGYTGVYADVDLVIKIVQPTVMSEPARAQAEMQLLAFALGNLANITPASGHLLDVNIYTSAHFLDVDLAGPSKASQVPEKAREAQAFNGKNMDFYQIRQGFGPDHEMAWRGFQKEALAAAAARDAKPGSKGGEVAELKRGFEWADSQWKNYHEQVDSAYAQLKADPEHMGKRPEVLEEMARTAVRKQSEDEVSRFLEKNHQLLQADSSEGAWARVEYDRLQQVMRSRSPEAYAGNAAVLWGSSNKAAQQGVIDSFASNPLAARSGRISHDQYILHWAVEMEGVKDLASRAWKAGKYDLRDLLFTNAALGQGVSLVEKMPNPEYQLHQERKQKDPGYEIPQDVPKEIPISRMEGAIDEARRNAQTPDQALKIWAKHFGSVEGAEKAMGSYLDVLRMTVLDSTGRHLASPVPGNSPVPPAPSSGPQPPSGSQPSASAPKPPAQPTSPPSAPPAALAQAPDAGPPSVPPVTQPQGKVPPVVPDALPPSVGPLTQPQGKAPAAAQSDDATGPATLPTGSAGLIHSDDAEPRTLPTGSPELLAAQAKAAGQPAKATPASAPDSTRVPRVAVVDAPPAGQPITITAAQAPQAKTYPLTAKAPTPLDQFPAPLQARFEASAQAEAKALGKVVQSLSDPAQQKVVQTAGPALLAEILRQSPVAAAAQAGLQSWLQSKLQQAGLPPVQAQATAQALQEQGTHLYPTLDPLYRIREQLAVAQPALMQALQPEYLASAERVQAQLQSLSQGQPLYEGLPTLSELLARDKAAWTGPREKAVLFQTYGKSYADGKQLEKHGEDLNSADFAFTPDSHELPGQLPNVNAWGQEKAGAVGQRPPSDSPDLPQIAAQLNLTLRGMASDPATGEVRLAPNQVTGVARDLADQMSAANVGQKAIFSDQPSTVKQTDIAPVMLDEMAMLRDSEVIYFGLTGKESLYPNGYTTAELLTVLNTPELLKKVVFFKFDPESEQQ